MSRIDALAALVQSFEEQPEKFRPVSIDVGDDAIRLEYSKLRKSRWTGDLASVTVKESYYFSSLRPLEILPTKGRWQVELANNERTVRRWLYFYSEDKAETFVRALSSLLQSTR